MYCTREMAFEKNDDASRQDVVRKLKYWVASCKKNTKQKSTHMSWFPETDDIPDEATLESMKLDESVMEGKQRKHAKAALQGGRRWGGRGRGGRGRASKSTMASSSNAITGGDGTDDAASCEASDSSSGTDSSDSD